MYNKIHLREEKWHLELGSSLSVPFWNSARRFYARIKFDNNLKWLQFQITRNSLQTNFIVSHFKNNVTAICSYCKNPDSLGKISHLFWSCPEVQHFVDEVSDYLKSIDIMFHPTKKEFLFGYYDIDSFMPKNYISLVMKKYIWLTKFRNPNLSLVGFRSLLKPCVVDLVFYLKIRNLQVIEWERVLNSL